MPDNSINILEIALDYINQGIVIYNMDLTVIGFNRRALELLEMPIDQFSIGDPFLKWVQYNAERGTYSDQGTVEERVEKRMAIARTFEPYKMIAMTSDNKTVEVIGRLIPSFGYILTYTDVTVRNNAEKLARESEERFKDYIELGSDWFWEMGPDLRFTYHSHRYFEITGFSPEEKIGSQRTKFVDSDSLNHEKVKWNNHFADLELRRPFKNFEYEFTGKTGKKICVRISGTPIFDIDGNFRGYRGIGTDITEVVLSAVELQKSTELFRIFIDNLPSAVNLKDKDGRYLIINREYREAFGLEQQPIIGKVISEFRPEKQSNDAALQEQEVISTKSVVTRAREVVTKDKGAQEFLVTKFPILDDQGEVTQIGTIGTEITQLKDTQSALILAKIDAEQARMDAETANRGKSDFLAAMSHDLRTPLNAIIGFAEAINLQYFGPISEKYQEYSNDIRCSGEHLLSLLGDILDVTAIESGKMAINKEKLKITDVIEECQKIIRVEAESLNIQIVSKIPDGLPLLFVDRQAVKKIILNLFANALKFTPYGGSVTIEAEASTDFFILRVCDTGIGISEDQIATITDPFVKGTTDPYQTQDGVGLGLAIVNSLVNLHDGNLNIQSDIGKGTTITISFPFAAS